MNGLHHPFTGALYEPDGDGHVVVTDRKGTSGTFTIHGRWVSGQLRECDPQLCGWVGGPRFQNHRVGNNRPDTTIQP